MHNALRAKAVARTVAALALLLASGSLLTGGPLASAGVPVRAAATAAQPASKVAPEVLSATTGGQVAPIAILLADQADVSAAYLITDRDARGRYVFDTLRAHAARTQAGVRAELDALGVSYTSFWVANVMFTHADRALVEKLAARSDVKLIESNASRRVIAKPPPPTKADGPLSPQTIEWNVARVHAPEVWSLGYEGQGIVIGIHDTGVQWDHPALKPQYRGWNGLTADHNFNWHDAIHSETLPCPGNSPAPCDGYNHGTHVAGIAVGDDGGSNEIGVAPGAKWIACRSMNNAQNGGAGTPESYTECFQFFIAPYDLAGQNANPSLRPHIINNSWGCDASEGCTGANLEVLKPVVENVQAAGIFVAASAGNSGSACESVSTPPAIFEAAFASGAITVTNNTDTLLSFSSRGPVTVDGSNRVKPDIVAPGVNIRSSMVNSVYGGNQGTSMASPHVAGAVALLWNTWPDLQRDITTTKTLLQSTADPNVSVPNNQVCGGTAPTTIPNNLFGYGLVDAYAAVVGHCQANSQDVYVTGSVAPGSITIPAGSTVRWTSEGDTHTSTSDTGLWDSGNLPPGEAFSYTFNTPGTYKYHCELHPGVTGTINVTEGCPPAASPTSTRTSTPTLTATPTDSATSTATDTATNTPTPSLTPQATATTTISSPTPTFTVQPSSSPTPCAGVVDVSLGSSGRNGPGGSCPPPPSATPTATSTSTSASPTPTSCSIQFADVPPAGEGSTFYSFIRCLACRSIVGGYPCGGAGEPCTSGEPYFRPNANVTRGQISKMVALAAQLGAPTGEQVFEDVAPGSPFYEYVQPLATAGYIGGYPCGTMPAEPCEAGDKPYFRPAANATRGQLTKIVSEAAQIDGDPGEPRFADVPEDSPFFVWTNRLANQGVVSGYPCGGPNEPCEGQDLPYFRPNSPVTRGQTAKIVANTFYPNCQTP